MEYEILLQEEQKYVNSKRFEHIVGVLQTVQKLSKLYYVNYTQCSLSAIFHDWCKDWSELDLVHYFENNNMIIEEKIPLIYHGIVSSHLNSQKYANLFTNQIKEAVLFHTTLNENVCDITKVLFIADYIEPSRIGKHYDNIRVLIGKCSLNEICYLIILQIQNYLNSINKKISKYSIAYIKEYQRNENICSN